MLCTNAETHKIVRKGLTFATEKVDAFPRKVARIYAKRCCKLSMFYSFAKIPNILNRLFINVLRYFRCHSVIVSKCQNRFWGFHSLLYKINIYLFYYNRAILHRKMKMTL